MTGASDPGMGRPASVHVGIQPWVLFQQRVFPCISSCVLGARQRTQTFPHRFPWRPGSSGRWDTPRYSKRFNVTLIISTCVQMFSVVKFSCYPLLWSDKSSPSPLHMWKYQNICEDVGPWGWLDHRDGAPMLGISAVILREHRKLAKSHERRYCLWGVGPH